MSSSYTDVFGNSLQTPVYNSFNSIGTFLVPFASNVQLLWSTQFQNNPYVVATIMNFYPSTNGWIVSLPDANQTSVGAQFYYNNPSAFSFSFHDFAGNLVATIPAGSTGILYLTDNSTQAGVWFNVPAGGGTSAVTSVNAAAVNSNDIANLLITGTPGLPITSAGTIDFSFIGDLAALIGFGSLPGIAVRTGASSPTFPFNNWSLRTLMGVPNQISITNGNGVSGNPTIGLAANIQNVTSIQVGNLQLFGNTIAVTAGSNLILSPQVGGATQTAFPISMLSSGGVTTPIQFWNPVNSLYTSIQGGSITGSNLLLTLPATPPTAGQALVNIAGGQLGWETIAGLPAMSKPNAIPKFINAGGELTSTGILVTGSADITNVNSMIVQGLRFCLDGALLLPTTISTTSNDLGLAPITGVTSLLAPLASVSTLLFYNAANVNFTGLAAPVSPTGITFALPPADAPANSLLMTDGSANLSFASSSTTHANAAGVAKAWVNFSVSNGGTGVITVNRQFNVSGVSWDSLGTYTITFGALSSSFYVAVIGSNQLWNTTTAVLSPLYFEFTRTATTLQIIFTDTAGIHQDAQNVSIIFVDL